MSKSRLSQVEQQIAALVEGSLARLFAGRLHPREVATRLARALDESARREASGGLVAPNVFQVRLNPDDHAALIAAHPNLADSLAQTVIELANLAGMRLDEPPKVHLWPDESMTPFSVVVEAHHDTASLRATQLMDSIAPDQAQQGSNAPRSPQLIIQGARHVALDRPVINIGRRQDNHIVISDMHISRTHAQLRLRFNRYVLYDLGSRGGTYVNGHRVTECILKPGDVISLAGVMMVYVEDEPSQSDLHDTAVQPFGSLPQPNRGDGEDVSDPTL